jgi:CBS domain-containing protein
MNDTTGSDAGFPPDVSGGAAPISLFVSDAVVTVPTTATLREVAATIVQETVGCAVIGSADQVDGIVSERDLAQLVAQGEDPDAVTAASLTDRPLVWVDHRASVEEVADEMLQGYVRHVLVGDDGLLVGVVSMRDVIAAYATA